MEQVNIRLPIYALVLGLIAGYYITSTYMPRIETKTVQIDHEVVRNQIVVHTVIKAADGTITETTTTDQSTHVTDSKDSSSTKVVAVPQWRVGAFTGLDHSYTALVERRILGPFSVAISANTQNQFNAGVTFEF